MSEPGKYLICRHRGDATGKLLNCQCDVDRNIYHCSVKVTCVKKLPPARDRQSYGAELDGVTICSECTSAE